MLYSIMFVIRINYRSKDQKFFLAELYKKERKMKNEWKWIICEETSIPSNADWCSPSCINLKPKISASLNVSSGGGADSSTASPSGVDDDEEKSRIFHLLFKLWWLLIDVGIYGLLLVLILVWMVGWESINADDVKLCCMTKM